MKHAIALIAVLCFAALACGAPAVTVSETAAPQPVIENTAPPVVIPSFTPIATLTPVPQATPRLSELLVMQPVIYTEEGQAPLYKITAQTPSLVGSPDPRVNDFNRFMSDLLKNEVDTFKNDVLQINSPPPPLVVVTGSSFDVKYIVTGQAGDLWSIKFENMGYVDGAAHPYHFSRTINYLLSEGRIVDLSELFLSGSNYLQVISDLCKAELATRDIGFDMDIFASGAEPLPENYARWNLSNEGLIITFDEYQVAPYAAGPQVVTIPFAALQAIIDPQGPMALFQ